MDPAPGYRPLQQLGPMASTISKGFSRNYSPQELTALATHINSSTKPLGSTLSQLNTAGIPYEDLGMLLSKMPGSRGMIAELQGQATSRMPNVGVDMGGGYGGVATSQGGYAPPAPNPGAMAGLASQMPQFNAGYPFNEGYPMEDRIPRVPRSPMDDEPILSQFRFPDEPIDRIPPNITPSVKGYYPPSQPILSQFRFPDEPIDRTPPNVTPSVKGYYPPSQPIGIAPQDRQPLAYGGDGGGIYGPGGMFPSYPTERIPERAPYMTDPYRGDPIQPPYMVDPYRGEPRISDEYNHLPQHMPNPSEYAPRAPDRYPDGVPEYNHLPQHMPNPSDDLFQTFNPFNDYGGGGGGG